MSVLPHDPVGRRLQFLDAKYYDKIVHLVCLRHAMLLKQRLKFFVKKLCSGGGRVMLVRTQGVGKPSVARAKNAV